MTTETGGIEALPEASEQRVSPVQWWRMLLALLGAAVILAGVVVGIAWLAGEFAGSPIWPALRSLFGL